jgi:hypothetical protein
MPKYLRKPFNKKVIGHLGLKFEYDYKEKFHNIFFFQQMNCYGNQNCGRQQWRKTRMEKQTVLEDCIKIGQTKSFQILIIVRN